MQTASGNPLHMEDPAPIIARAVYEANLSEGDAPFDELEDEDRIALIDWAQGHLTAHLQWLTQQSIRLVPPGVALRPKSDEEAAAMLQAVREYRAAKGRKGGLIGSVAPKKLILPPGIH